MNYNDLNFLRGISNESWKQPTTWNSSRPKDGSTIHNFVILRFYTKKQHQKRCHVSRIHIALLEYKTPYT